MARTTLIKRLRAHLRPRDFRGWALLIAGLLALLLGTVGLTEPVENVLRTTRVMPFKNPVSGNIVLVGIDSRSLSEVGTWPWSRANFAKAIAQVDAAKPKRIFIDHEFIVKADPQDEQKLIDVVKRTNSRVVIAHEIQTKMLGDVKSKPTLNPSLAHHVDQVSISVWVDFLRYVWGVEYSVADASGSLPSMAAMLAGKSGRDGSVARIDYRLDPATVPVVSAADVIAGKVKPSFFEGKQVIIAPTALKTMDYFPLPGSDSAPGVYVQILAAETLMSGTPIDLGLLPAFLVALILGYASIKARKPALGVAISASAAIGCLVIPFLTESYLIYFDLVPALLVSILMTFANMWAVFGKRRSQTNLVSGLPNLGALREVRNMASGDVVVAIARNWPEIALTLTEDQEEIFLKHLVGRLEAGSGGAKLYHIDQGTFAWFAHEDAENPIGEQLEGLFQLFQSPIKFDDRSIDVAICLGLDSRTDLDNSRRYDGARIAALEASEKGARWQRFDASDHEDVQWRVAILGELDQAIEKGEVWVAYQPKVDALNRSLKGLEALARWSHPMRGDIRPDEFIPYAEDNGRIGKLTEFVLDSSLRDASSLKIDGGIVPVAVNLSARCLEDDMLMDLIESKLQYYNYPAAKLTLELTESAAIRDGQKSIERLEALISKGIRISIDDYGTGFSTLGYMKNVPAHEIKIDRSFISGLEDHHRDRLLVSSTIELAHSLDRVVVAEGVERESTVKLLQEMGCDILQGYLTGAPASIEVLRQRYTNDQTLSIAA